MTADRAVPAVAVCAIVRDEESYVKEWVEFHRRQGVSVFRIYDNGSVDGTPDVLRELGIEPVVWAGRPTDFDQQQRTAYAEGATMLAEYAEWVAFIDADEFIFGRGGKTLAEALADIPVEISAIAVQQRVFGSGNQKTRLPGAVLRRFTRCAAANCSEHAWFKTIARPKLISGFDSVHSVVLHSGVYAMVDKSPLTRGNTHPGEASRRVDGPISLHHYPLKSLQEYRQKQAKWADRSAGSRIDDDYFFKRDIYANEVECLDLSGFDDQDLTSRGDSRQDQQVIFLQTADPFVYKTMFDLTSRITLIYCQRHGFAFEGYLGVKRGVQAWMAIYNRIFMLQELRQRGYTGWVTYLDADAFVTDLTFDLRTYLAESNEYCLVIATGGTETPYDVNTGVFFLNLGDPDGRALADDWMARYQALVPEEFLNSVESVWRGRLSDQQLLYEVLKANPRFLRRMRKLQDGLINYVGGRFIRQAITASFCGMDQRLDWIRTETGKALDAHYRSISMAGP